MNFKSLSWLTSLLGLFIAGPLLNAQSSGETQNITLAQKVQIPGATLKPGSYTFSIEDRLQDRAIVRISSQEQNEHFLVLSVPNSKLNPAGADGLIRFTSSKGKDEALRGWACPTCSPALEFVYPKAEAVKLTDATAEPVVAVDPSSDKLPENLSADDMKVVTLWLLAPETITPDNRGKGVKAEKWASVAQPASADQMVASKTPELAQPSAPRAAQDIQPATGTNATPARPTSAQSTASLHRPRLPKTAGNDYLYLFCGSLLIAAALGLKLSNSRL